jgi:hypothetical protein
VRLQPSANNADISMEFGAGHGGTLGLLGYFKIGNGLECYMPYSLCSWYGSY